MVMNLEELRVSGWRVKKGADAGPKKLDEIKKDIAKEQHEKIMQQNAVSFEKNIYFVLIFRVQSGFCDLFHPKLENSLSFPAVRQPQALSRQSLLNGRSDGRRRRRRRRAEAHGHSAVSYSLLGFRCSFLYFLDNFSWLYSIISSFSRSGRPWTIVSRAARLPRSVARLRRAPISRRRARCRRQRSSRPSSE